MRPTVSPFAPEEEEEELATAAEAAVAAAEVTTATDSAAADSAYASSSRSSSAVGVHLVEIHRDDGPADTKRPPATAENVGDGGVTEAPAAADAQLSTSPSTTTEPTLITSSRLFIR